MATVFEQQGRDYFLRLFNGMADAVFIAECHSDGTPGQYIEVNDVACEMLQLSREQLLKLSPYQINRVALEDQSAYVTIIDDIRTSGKTLYKTELLSSGDRWIPVEIGSQLFELDGQNVFFSVVRDITLREKYEALSATSVTGSMWTVPVSGWCMVMFWKSGPAFWMVNIGRPPGCRLRILHFIRYCKGNSVFILIMRWHFFLPVTFSL